MILAIDPGTTHTAWLMWENNQNSCLGATGVKKKGFSENITFKNSELPRLLQFAGIVAIEMIASYGMPVGKEVFETCYYIGRLQEKCETLVGIVAKEVYRKDVKIHICGSMKAKDGNIRQALIDRIGPQGKKACPGPTYGLAKHDWSALAIAVYVADTMRRTAGETA